MKFLHCLVACCLAIASVNKVSGASYTWSGKAGDHLWANPLNWLPTSGPPTSGDSVTMNAFQVELDSSISLASLNLSSTIVTGTGALTLAGPSTLAYANFNNASLTINAQTDIYPGPGADVETAIACPTVNSSTVVVHTGAQFIVNSGNTAINNGSWGFDSQSSLNLPSVSNQVSFLNNGSLYFTNATLDTALGSKSSILSNASGGTIFSVQTNIMNGPVALAGTIQTASNSVFQIANDGGLALYNGAIVTGPGITAINTSCAVNGNVNVTGGLQLFTDGANTGGAMIVNGKLEIGQNGRFYWYGGALAGVGTNITGTVQVDQQGILYIINDANGMSLQNIILTNNGSVLWTNSGSLSLANNAVIANQLNFYIAGDSILRPLPNDTSSVLFTNSGLVIKTSGSTNGQTAIRVPFYDGGTLHVQQGNIYLYNGGSINNWIADSNCLVNISSGTFNSQPSANFNATGAIDFSGTAFINVPPSATLNIAGAFNHNGGVFYGSGQVMVVPGNSSQTVYQWNAGMISITNQSGAFVVNPGAYMYIEGGSNFKGLAAGALINKWLIFWTNDNSIGGITMSNLAVISNLAGFHMQCDSYLNDGSTGSNAAPVFYNAPGSIVDKTAKTGSSTILVAFKDAGYVQASSGTIEFANFSDNYPALPVPTITLSGGKVQFDQSLVLRANISGSGQITAQKSLTFSSPGKMTVTAITLAGNITNNEVIDLSNFGVLTLAGGQFTQIANGSLIFTLQSTNAGAYSKVNGQAVNVFLGGGIQATLAYGGAPPIGTSFPVVTSAQLFNKFTNVSVPQGMTVVYTNNTASIVVTNAVPAVLEAFSNGTNFGFQFATVTNQVYIIEETTNLPPKWTPVTNFTALSSNFTFEILERTNTVDFFRAR